MVLNKQWPDTTGPRLRGGPSALTTYRTPRLLFLVSNESTTARLRCVISGTDAYYIQMLMPTEIQLLETMRVSEGEIFLLKRHMERIWRSSQALGFTCNTDVVGA